MADIKNVQDFQEAIEPSSSLGYPTYYVCADGGILCWDAAVGMKDLIIQAIDARNSDSYANEDKQWDVVAYEIHYEGEPLICDHTGNKIESAYGVPDSDTDNDS